MNEVNCVLFVPSFTSPSTSLSSFILFHLISFVSNRKRIKKKDVERSVKKWNEMKHEKEEVIHGPLLFCFVFF